jgi:hypothetical protein
MRPGKIDGPLTHDSIEKAFHELGKVHDGKIAGDLAIFLTFRYDFA